jgi:hypothetical protein
VAAPLPASVVTLHANAGCAASPPTGHADAGAHGCAPAAPPAQKKPLAQTAGVALVDPAAQPYPGAASAHGAHVALLVAFTATDHVPAGHGVGAADAAPHQAPGGQPAQAAAPADADNVPAGQGVATPAAHEKPRGQIAHAGSGHATLAVSRYECSSPKPDHVRLVPERGEQLQAALPHDGTP